MNLTTDYTAELSDTGPSQIARMGPENFESVALVLLVVKNFGYGC
jgi:hypothetical protein